MSAIAKSIAGYCRKASSNARPARNASDGYSVLGTRYCVRSPPSSLEAPMLTLRGHEGPVRSLAYSPDGRLLASGGEDGTIRLWELSTTVIPLLVRHVHGDWVSSLTFAPGEVLLLSGG